MEVIVACKGAIVAFKGAFTISVRILNAVVENIVAFRVFSWSYCGFQGYFHDLDEFRRLE